MVLVENGSLEDELLGPPKVPFSTSKSHKFWVSCHEAHHLNSHDLPWLTAWLHSLKLTAKAPENGWLEDEFPIGARPFFRCELFFFQGG